MPVFLTHFSIAVEDKMREFIDLGGKNRNIYSYLFVLVKNNIGRIHKELITWLFGRKKKSG